MHKPSSVHYSVGGNELAQNTIQPSTSYQNPKWMSNNSKPTTCQNPKWLSNNGEPTTSQNLKWMSNNSEPTTCQNLKWMSNNSEPTTCQNLKWMSNNSEHTTCQNLKWMSNNSEPITCQNMQWMSNNSEHTTRQHPMWVSNSNKPTTTCQNPKWVSNGNEPTTTCQNPKWVSNSNNLPTTCQEVQWVPIINKHSTICEGVRLVQNSSIISAMCRGIQLVPYTKLNSSISRGFQLTTNSNIPSTTHEGLDTLPNTCQLSTRYQVIEPVHGSINETEWMPCTSQSSTMCQTFGPACLHTMETPKNQVRLQQVEMNKTQPLVAIPNLVIPIPYCVPRPVHSSQEESSHCRRKYHAISIEDQHTDTPNQLNVPRQSVHQCFENYSGQESRHYIEKYPLHTRICKFGEKMIGSIIHYSVSDTNETVPTKSISVNSCNTSVSVNGTKDIEAAVNTDVISMNSTMTRNVLPNVKYFEILKKSSLKFEENDYMTASRKYNMVNDSDISIFQSRGSEAPTKMYDETKSLNNRENNPKVTVSKSFKLPNHISKCMSEPTVRCHVTDDPAIVFESNLDKPAAFETIANNVHTNDRSMHVHNLTSEIGRTSFESTNDRYEDYSELYLDEFFNDKTYVYGKSLMNKSPGEIAARSTVEHDLQLSEDFAKFISGIASPCFRHLKAHSVCSNRTNRIPIHVQRETRFGCNFSDLVDVVVDELLHATPTNTAEISNMITNDVSQHIHSQADELKAVDSKMRWPEHEKQDASNTSAINLHMSSIHLTADALTHEAGLKLDAAKSGPEPVLASRIEGIGSVVEETPTSSHGVTNNLLSTTGLPKYDGDRTVFNCLESYVSGFPRVAFTSTSNERSANRRTSSDVRKSDTMHDAPTKEVIGLHPFQSFLSELQDVSNTDSLFGGITFCPIKPTVCVSEPMSGIEYWDNHCSVGTGQSNQDLPRSCFKTDLKYGSNQGKLLQNATTVYSHHDGIVPRRTERQQLGQDEAHGPEWSGLFTSCELPSYRQKRKTKEPATNEGRITRPPKIVRL